MLKRLLAFVPRRKKCSCCGGDVDARLAYAEFHRNRAVQQRMDAILEHRATEAVLNRSIRTLEGIINAMRAGEAS